MCAHFVQWLRAARDIFSKINCRESIEGPVDVEMVALHPTMAICDQLVSAAGVVIRLSLHWWQQPDILEKFGELSCIAIA